MSTYYLQTFKKALENPDITAEHVLTMMENTDFFLKVLRVKLESRDPELLKQAMDELKEFRTLLATHENPRSSTRNAGLFFEH